MASTNIATIIKFPEDSNNNNNNNNNNNDEIIVEKRKVLRNSPRKPHRFLPGTTSLREIKKRHIPEIDRKFDEVFGNDFDGKKMKSIRENSIKKQIQVVLTLILCEILDEIHYAMLNGKNFFNISATNLAHNCYHFFMIENRLNELDLFFEKKCNAINGNLMIGDHDNCCFKDLIKYFESSCFYDEMSNHFGSLFRKKSIDFQVCINEKCIKFDYDNNNNNNNNNNKNDVNYSKKIRKVAKRLDFEDSEDDEKIKKA